jgi:hypothetical protein
MGVLSPKFYNDDRLHDALKKETPNLRWSNQGPAGSLRYGNAPRRRGRIIVTTWHRRVKGSLLRAAIPFSCPSRWSQIQNISEFGLTPVTLAPVMERRPEALPEIKLFSRCSFLEDVVEC